MQPKTLAHYEILSPLGAGGMGEVYRARDTRLGREVALKTLPPDMAADPERLARFQTEAKALAALDHPNIVTVHSVEEAEGVHFLTMASWRGRPWTGRSPRPGFLWAGSSTSPFPWPTPWPPLTSAASSIAT